MFEDCMYIQFKLFALPLTDFLSSCWYENKIWPQITHGHRARQKPRSLWLLFHILSVSYVCLSEYMSLAQANASFFSRKDPSGTILPLPCKNVSGRGPKWSTEGHIPCDTIASFFFHHIVKLPSQPKYKFKKSSNWSHVPAFLVLEECLK